MTSHAASSPDFDVSIDAHATHISVRSLGTFGADSDSACERFVSKVFSVASVESIAVDRVKGYATIGHRAGLSGLAALLQELSSVLVYEACQQNVRLQNRVLENRFTLFRYGHLVTPWEVLSDRSGRLEIRRLDVIRWTSLADALYSIPGVTAVRMNRLSKRIIIEYDSPGLNAYDVLSWLDQHIDGDQGWVTITADPPTPYGLAPAAVGVAASAVVIPELAIASAVLLVGMNVRTVEDCWKEVRERRPGLPTLYSTIMLTTLATGQFLGAALMTWLFRYWNRRFKERLQQAQRDILATYLPKPRSAGRLMDEGMITSVSTETLVVGDLFALSPADIVPADATVVDGEGILGQITGTGHSLPTCKRVGDTILAGSTLIAGRLTARVDQIGSGTQAGVIGQILMDVTTPTAGARAPSLKGETLANQAVPPTLILAGLGGIAVGDLMTAGAILRPDYATGLAIAGSINHCTDVADSLFYGGLIRTSDVLEKLSRVRAIILDDGPIVRSGQTELADVEGRLEPDALLPLSAGVYRHGVDDRALALLKACRDQGLEPLAVNILTVEVNGVTAEFNGHRLWVGSLDDTPAESQCLWVTIDEMPVGRLAFTTSARPAAAETLDALRNIRPDLTFSLISSQRGEAIDALAVSLGIQTREGGLEDESKADCVRRYRNLMGPVAFIGDCRTAAAVAAEADIVIDVSRDISRAADISLLTPDLSPLPDLWRIADRHAKRDKADGFGILGTNLFCVAGAFLFGFNSLHAVLISNLGTWGVYRGATLRLDRRRSPARF
jgi:cation transport ATPase